MRVVELTEGSKIELLKDVIFKSKQNQLTEGSILANLIEQLLIINGYVIKANPGSVPGEGNYIEAIRYDRLLGIDDIDRLFIEIRDQDNNSDGISFGGLKRMQKNPKYADHGFFLMSCEEISDVVKEEFANHNIRVLDGENLADWVFKNIDDISATTARKKHLSH